MTDTIWDAGDIAADFARSPFISGLQLSVLAADQDRQVLRVRAPFLPGHERLPDSNQWHGGPMAAIIDTVGDYALAMSLARPLPTVNFRVDYVRPAIATDLIVTASVRRRGRMVGVVDVDVCDEQERLVAVGRATYATAG